MGAPEVNCAPVVSLLKTTVSGAYCSAAFLTLGLFLELL